MCIQHPAFRIHIGRFDRETLCSYNIQKILILYRLLKDQCHIVCCRIMVFIRHSTGIYKMCIHTAKFLRTLIHHICKRRDRSCHMNRNLRCHIVSRTDHQCHQTLPHCQNFTNLHSQISTVRSLIGKTFLCKCNFFVQTAVFQCQKCCHDLGNTCRVAFLIHSFIIQNRSRIRIHQYCCFGICIRSLWPVRDCICRNRIRCPVIYLCCHYRDPAAQQKNSCQDRCQLLISFFLHFPIPLLKILILLFYPISPSTSSIDFQKKDLP